MTLHFNLEKVSITDDLSRGWDITDWGTDRDFMNLDAELTSVSEDFTPPSPSSDYRFASLSRYFYDEGGKEEFANIKMVVMPGMRLSWHYTGLEENVTPDPKFSTSQENKLFIWYGKITTIFYTNSHQIRFINLVESLDENIAWENLKTVRKNYIKNYKGSSCKFLVANGNINENNVLFMNLVNASSSNLQKNITKDVINKGAKMFVYLNSCSKTSTKENFYSFFKKVYEKLGFQYSTNSGMILYTLSAMKLFPNDGRIIASRILEKISTLFELTFIKSKKDRLTMKANNSMFITPTYRVNRYIHHWDGHYTEV